jgi:hypothetical protein
VDTIGDAVIEVEPNNPVTVQDEPESVLVADGEVDREVRGRPHAPSASLHRSDSLPSPSTTGHNSGGLANGGGTPFEGEPFVCGPSSPDSGILAELDGPLQAGFNDLAPMADDLCLLDLDQRGGGVPSREEQFGVLIEAGRAVKPSHQARFLASGSAIRVVGAGSEDSSYGDAIATTETWLGGVDHISLSPQCR